MERIKHNSGAIEYIPSEDEKKFKDKYKDKKKGSDLTDAQTKELVYETLESFNLIITSSSAGDTTKLYSSSTSLFAKSTIAFVNVGV